MFYPQIFVWQLFRLFIPFGYREENCCVCFVLFIYSDFCPAPLLLILWQSLHSTQQRRPKTSQPLKPQTSPSGACRGDQGYEEGGWGAPPFAFHLNVKRGQIISGDRIRQQLSRFLLGGKADARPGAKMRRTSLDHFTQGNKVVVKGFSAVTRPGAVVGGARMYSLIRADY